MLNIQVMLQFPYLLYWKKIHTTYFDVFHSTRFSQVLVTALTTQLHIILFFIIIIFYLLFKHND